MARSRATATTEPALVLRGPPDNLVGVLALANEAKEPRRFRALRLAEAGFSLADRPGRRRLVVRQELAGGERRQVPVQFTLEATTPPGSYEVTFASEHGEHRARLEVLPQRRLAILPARFEAEAAPGEVVTTPVVVTNEGNVPLELGTLGVMVLEETQQVCLSLQHALGAAKGKDYETFLNALVGSLSERKVDFVRVRLGGDGLKLAPGETAAASLELHIPGNAQAGRSYQARMAVLNQALFLRLHTRATGPARR